MTVSHTCDRFVTKYERLLVGFLHRVFGISPYVPRYQQSILFVIQPWRFKSRTIECTYPQEKSARAITVGQARRHIDVIANICFSPYLARSFRSV